MGFITADAIRELAAFSAGDALVTTCYLDVDGRRHIRLQDCELELERVLRGARDRANGSAVVHKDFQRIEEYVRGGFDRSRTRGLAFFSCAAAGLWEVVALPVPVTSRVVIAPGPAVGPLESVLQEADRVAILLVDRQRARLWLFELGELVDRSEVFDELPRAYDSRGEREKGDPSAHVDALAAAHLRHSAQVAFDVYQDKGFDRIYLGAPDALSKDIESAFHPYVRQRLGGRVSLGVSASADEVRSVALDLEAEVRRTREQAAIDRLRTAVATGGRAAAGLAAVLENLGGHRVERLFVSDGFSQSGWLCGDCGRLSAVGRTCAGCGGEMEPVEDVVEVTVERLLVEGTPVEICVGNADLDVLGRIGALLRY